MTENNKHQTTNTLSYKNTMFHRFFNKQPTTPNYNNKTTNYNKKQTITNNEKL